MTGVQTCALPIYTATAEPTKRTPAVYPAVRTNAVCYCGHLRGCFERITQLPNLTSQNPLNYRPCRIQPCSGIRLAYDKLPTARHLHPSGSREKTPVGAKRTFQPDIFRRVVERSFKNEGLFNFWMFVHWKCRTRFPFQKTSHFTLVFIYVKNLNLN